MPSIAATAVNAKSYVRLDVDFTDTDAPYALVQRVDGATGATTAVRTHGDTTTVNGVAYANLNAGYTGVFYDTECPLDSPCYYTATAPAAQLNINKNFAAGSADPWYPGASTTATIQYGGDLTAYSSESSVYLYQVTGDGVVATPQVFSELFPVTPGANLTVTMSFTIGSATIVAGALLQFLASDGTTVLSTVTATTAAGSAGFATVTGSGTAPASTVYGRIVGEMTGTPASNIRMNIVLAKVTSAAASASSGAVLAPSLGACWLKDPLRPGNNVRVDLSFDPNPGCTPTEGVFFQSIDAEVVKANAASFNVNNQAEPVVVSKTRSSATSTLTLVCRTFSDRDRMLALVNPGTPLLWQVPDEYGSTDRYLAVGDVTFTRVLPDHRFPIRVCGLPYAVTRAPGGPSQGVAGARWQDTCNQYATWTAVNGAGKTWTNVLDGGIG